MFEFKGIGKRVGDDARWPEIDRLDLLQLDDPEGYQVFDEELVQAVNTALALGMPLLLTGEPGVGKSTLAQRIAYELDCGDPLVYRVKSTSEGSDLLYRVDTMRRMVDAYIDSNRQQVGDIRNYLRFNPLGLAILRTLPLADLDEYGLTDAVWQNTSNPEPSTSVVLIDEIDKAPADLPNDLLEEIRRLEFTVPELDDAAGRPIELGVSNAGAATLKPFVLVTSNAVRSLPEAFLRRCVYYHMKLPRRDDHNPAQFEQFTGALETRVRDLFTEHHDKQHLDARIKAGWETFWLIREASGLSRVPSTGEGMSWMVAAAGAIAGEPGSERWQRVAIKLLVKNDDDVETARSCLRDKFSSDR